jgi:hypothetical protein
MIMVTFFVTSCGPASKIKRAERLIEQAIAKGAKVDSTKYIVIEGKKRKYFYEKSKEYWEARRNRSMYGKLKSKSES